jgi:hypothetical protein
MNENDHSPRPQLQGELSATPVKDGWVKPEIVEFKPVTAARGVAYRLGDGVSNLS